MCNVCTRIGRSEVLKAMGSTHELQYLSYHQYPQYLVNWRNWAIEGSEVNGFPAPPSLPNPQRQANWSRWRYLSQSHAISPIPSSPPTVKSTNCGEVEGLVVLRVVRSPSIFKTPNTVKRPMPSTPAIVPFWQNWAIEGIARMEGIQLVEGIEGTGGANYLQKIVSLKFANIGGLQGVGCVGGGGMGGDIIFNTSTTQNTFNTPTHFSEIERTEV